MISNHIQIFGSSVRINYGMPVAKKKCYVMLAENMLTCKAEITTPFHEHPKSSIHTRNNATSNATNKTYLPTQLAQSTQPAFPHSALAPAPSGLRHPCRTRCTAPQQAAA
jgi:hypothetical protein